MKEILEDARGRASTLKDHLIDPGRIVDNINMSARFSNSVRGPKAHMPTITRRLLDSSERNCENTCLQ